MGRPGIKICGIRDSAALGAALSSGADHIGLVFVPQSPRHVALEAAAALAHEARGRARIVGLFVDPDLAELEAAQRAVGLDVIQLHGQETAAFAATVRGTLQRETWKAIGVRTRADLEAAHGYAGAADRVLYDAKPPEGDALPGGTGLRIDWRLLAGVRHPLPWILAGGLDPDNVAEAMAITGADFVDVSSGVESARGIKDAGRIAAFCAAALGQ
ncbi:phosphoribosylanthranilate isomerase [Novosphingobium sp.]|uniref:phosphoribosylanthranilate isomerase n=1 Tax=Novosphingobium sp. TaxID=1874826 RepID=UPI001EC4FCC0|nr:phosphoribosylanthranilate isomerase [Novosphingobium sp.]MBK6801722.1 phosphoribosylanthranilate isomerase [Novosphingobium sp.]MBK9010436.1 phosphoribosylanthranilate isomerase [Novosphingobium sp.]